MFLCWTVNVENINNIYLNCYNPTEVQISLKRWTWVQWSLSGGTFGCFSPTLWQPQLQPMGELPSRPCPSLVDEPANERCSTVFKSTTLVQWADVCRCWSSLRWTQRANSAGSPSSPDFNFEIDMAKGKTCSCSVVSVFFSHVTGVTVVNVY